MSAGGDNAETRSASGFHPDVQRSALRDVVALATVCTDGQIRADRDYETALRERRAAFEKTVADIEQRFAEEAAAVEQQYHEMLTKIAAQYEADMATLRASEDSARHRIDADRAAASQEVGRKLKDAEWMAVSLFEGTQARLREEAKAAQKTFASQRALIEDMEQRAAALAYQYGLAWQPTGATGEGAESEEHPPDPPPPAAPAESFDGHCAAAEERLHALERLTLPRFCLGAVPFLGCLLLCGLAAAAAQLATGSSVPNWKAIGIAVGVTLAGALVAWGVLRGKALAQLNDALLSLNGSLDAARRAARHEYERQNREREARFAEAVKRRDAELQDARQKYKPVLTAAQQQQESMLKSLGAEHERLLAKIKAQRDRGRSEAETWRGRNLDDIRRRREEAAAAAAENHARETASIEQRYRDACDALQRQWNGGLDRILTALGEKNRTAADRPPPWDDAGWATWIPPKRFATAVPFGELEVDLRKFTGEAVGQWVLPEPFSVPALLAFPDHASLLLHTDHAGRTEAIRTLQLVMARLLTMMPAGRVRFTIVDPVGLGQNFAGFMHLADYDEALVGPRIWTDGEHIEARLADLQEHMETVIQKYLRNEFATIDDYNAQAAELAEPYRFLVIADFPTNFSDVAVRRLASIASTGARCGVHTLIVRDTRQPVPGNVPLDEIETHSVNLVREENRFVWRDDVFRRFPLTLDAPPADDRLTQILHVVGRHAKDSRRVEVPFDTIAPTDEQAWTGRSAADVQVPIGRMGATRLQMMRLGRGVAQHVLIAGKTGSGKSTLLHVLVTNLALWYSPDEIELYLIDFKKGVEFKAYATHALPHARAIAVESDREFGLSVLQRVDAEMTRRGALFRKLGVQDLVSYRETAAEPMPRTLLIIDEFQEFFSEDDRLAQDAGLLLDRLVRQGRAFGIHVLLGSQTIGGTSGLARSTLGQMAVRIALQCSEADSQLILGDSNFAARLLSRPGEAIYNDAGGLVEGNSPFQVAWLADERREELLARVRERWPSGDRREPAIVFEGNVPADIRRNTKLDAALRAARPASIPTAPAAWLGEPVAIKEPTAVTLRRQSGANVLLVGQQEEAALAILGAMMISLAAQHPRGALSFQVLDGTPADSPLAGALVRIASALPHETRFIEYRAAGDAIGELAEELRRRQEADAANAPAVYLIVYGMQRYRVLRKQEDSFGFSMSDEEKKPQPGRQFADLLREGPPLGMHVLAWSDTPAAVERTLDRGSLREFDNRVLFQMSAADSSNLIDSPLANKLGVHRALYYSEEQGVTEKFRPYALPKPDWLEEVKRWLHR